MFEVVGYARYSTNNQSENSIDYQLEAMQKYCAINNMRITNYYIDEAQSGYNAQRDSFQRLLTDAKKGKILGVIFYDMSRISRNVVDWFEARELFRKSRIKLFSCTELIGEADDPASFLSESMKAIISQHFVMETRKKVIAGQTSKAKKGVFLGGSPPLGYDIKNRNYIINEYEAEIVKHIFRLYKNGWGYKKIIQDLKEKNYKTKYKQNFSLSSLKIILKNERYIGTYTWNKQSVKYFGKSSPNRHNPNIVRIENKIPTIIDKKTWEGVQKRMESKQKGESNIRRNYLLSGIIRCGKCGSAFLGITKKNSISKEYSYYVCSNKQNKKMCDCKNMNAFELEELVINILNDELLNSDIVEKSSNIVYELLIKNNDDQKEIKLKSELRDANKKISNLIDVLSSGLDSISVRNKINNWKQKKLSSKKVCINLIFIKTM